MDARRHALAAAVAATLAVSAIVGPAGCERPYLTWTPREPLAARRGRVAIAVEDRREGDHRSLGRAFGWGGAPAEITTAGDHVRARVEQLVRTATITAGLGLAAPAEPPTARIEVVVSSLRCDGTHRKAEARLEVTVSVVATGIVSGTSSGSASGSAPVSGSDVDAGGEDPPRVAPQGVAAQSVAPQTIAAQARGGDCENALEQTLDVLLDELAARLVAGPLHDAALGG